MAERFSLQEWTWIGCHEKNRALSWICTVQRYKREKSKPTALKHSQLKIQKPVVCAGTWWNKYTVTFKSSHPNPTAVKPEERFAHLPLCDCPGISRAFSSWEQNVVLPVAFFWCPLPGGLKASPLEWHGTHKQFYSLWFPKMFWKYPADYWRAKHHCDAVSHLVCAFV